MFCEKCGSAINNDSSYCSNCGAFQNRDTSLVNGEYQSSTYGSNSNYSGYRTTFADENLDKSNVGLNILSWFVPIFGIIYYFLKKNEKPKAAKGTLKTSLISISLNFIAILIIFVLGIIGATNTTKDLMEDELSAYEDRYESYDDYEDQNNDYYFDNEDNGNKNSSGAEKNTTENTTTSDKNNINVSNNWKTYTVYINNKSVKLPLSYEDFVKITGCTFEDAQDKQTTLKSNYYTFVTLKDSKGNTFTAQFDNNDDNITTLDKCTITAISTYEQYENNANIVFPGNLRVGDSMTEEKLKELFGTPDDTWYAEEEDDSFEYTYYENYDKYFSSRSFEITVYDGLINDISIEKSY